ncbi:MAG TPA: hypothetical protein VMS60_00180 [Solirubrobacterales bacterium]|nr:hypothetical protein [Solirubrobacterales bacterium]
MFSTDLIEPFVLIAVTIWNARQRRPVKDESVSIRIEIWVETGAGNGKIADADQNVSSDLHSRSH